MLSGGGSTDVQLHHIDEYTFCMEKLLHDTTSEWWGAVLTFCSDDYIFAVVGY